MAVVQRPRYEMSSSLPRPVSRLSELKVHIVNTPMEFSSCMQVCLLLTLSLGWVQATHRPDEHVSVTDKPRHWFAEKLSDSTERPQDGYRLPIIPSQLLAVTEDVTRLHHLDWTLRPRSKRDVIRSPPQKVAITSTTEQTTEALPECNPPLEYNEFHSLCEHPRGNTPDLPRSKRDFVASPTLVAIISTTEQTTEALRSFNRTEVYNRLRKRYQTLKDKRENPKHSYKLSS